jgi:thioredoxin reductase (NADPH)
MPDEARDRPASSGRATILAVDDGPEDLDVLRRELGKRYGVDYDVRCEASAAAALRALEDLARHQQPVALVLAHQWMSEMPGTELLGRVRDIHPTAKRGLLISWGDRAASEPILRAMALGGFDFYLPKPAAEPDEGFHSIVEGLLAEWSKDHNRGFAPVVIVGDQSSRRVHELRDVFTRNGLLHQTYEPESDAGAQRLAAAGLTADRGPVVFVLDAPPLVDPSNAEIVDVFGVNTANLAPEFDVIVVGAGPAGLGAAVYGASEGLATLVIEREALGGQASTSSRIRNFLGFPTGVSGRELATRAYEQAWLFGAAFHFMNPVVGLRRTGDRHVVVLSDGTELATRAVVLACGVSYRRLDTPNVERLIGSGVFYGAAVSEAPAVRARRVFVAGGGNSAGQAAIHLAKYADSVTVLVRGEGLAQTMSQYLVTEIGAHPRISVRTRVEVVDADGHGRLEHLTLLDRASGATEHVPADALFVLIGAEPHTDWLPAAVQRDQWGFIVTGADLLRDGALPAAWTLDRSPMLLETSVPGVFAVGDVRHRSIKRVASAVGEGSVCVSVIHEYLAQST